eukprot:1159092-Pelagomonas_calceolata.AAC.2
MTGLPPLSNIYDPYDAGIQAPTYFTASMSHLEGQEGHSRLKAGILKQGAARSFPPTLVPLEIDMMCHPCVLAELGHVALVRQVMPCLVPCLRAPQTCKCAARAVTDDVLAKSFSVKSAAQGTLWDANARQTEMELPLEQLTSHLNPQKGGRSKTKADKIAQEGRPSRVRMGHEADSISDDALDGTGDDAWDKTSVDREQLQSSALTEDLSLSLTNAHQSSH